MRRVAYYAHHHGSGHLHHARNKARNPDFEVLVLTSASKPASWPASVRYEQLGSDVVVGYEPVDDEPFHYVPVGRSAATVRARFRQVLDALESFDADVVVSDVSAEIAAFARLLTYPTIVRRMHGHRDDLAHRNMYRLADGVVSYFPTALDQEFTDEHGAKTANVGMFAVDMPTVDGDNKVVVEPDNEVVVVQTSLGGAGVSLDWVNAAARQTPNRQWRVVGRTSSEPVEPNVELLGIIDDPRHELSRAGVIVSSAGHNAVRMAVSAQRPLLLLPEPRPFDEQHCFATALERLGDVRTVDPPSADWVALLDEATHQDVRRLHTALFVDESTFHERCAALVDRVSGEHAG